ncbi:glutathione S-transferase family protein [Aspergillus aculeatinus CBS 121060]|uniref:Glutathione S-transferase Ure2-like protein n=1 Tax=Aspergillus aculeatinus CBS 121060 TaxID=1448322 RepID=A0ACD1H1V3_9EURO|nr:glutathione S-transferase Ure2-like protein [Aspergillus aculeatinus CBS 121060]RAH67558.1 glutathione S-transferase Ure2-like protein [Aspergillus aculeatinus CBS 121060]
MPSLKPIVLYTHGNAPNPLKVAIILKELNVPYESENVPLDELKQEPFESINPNGRLPAIKDPNTGLTVWESGAIVEYLLEKYDHNLRLSFSRGSPEYFEAKQWLFFQVSGQGPYFGQAAWFTLFHPEKIQSAKARYVNEIRRVTGVLNRVLKDKKYLVGDSCSYADISFLPWYGVVPKLFTEEVKLEEDFPHVSQWLERIHGRECVREAVEEFARNA